MTIRWSNPTDGLSAGSTFRLFMSSALLVVTGGAAVVAADPRSPDTFEDEVAPLLIERCIECHRGSSPSGGLDLSTAAGITHESDSGHTILPGLVSESYLMSRIRDGEMPPPERGQPRPLSEDQIRIFSSWIEKGATWPEGRTLDLYERTTATRGGRDWWSFQPITNATPPSVSDAEDVRKPIDAFIQSRLTERGWIAAEAADRRTLVRRMSIDLTGLPPTFEQINDFVTDRSPHAYENLVNRLIASPAFGEKWGRHWLDVVRFAETSGYERDQVKPQAWRYRDWVVRAINEDLPFDQFVTHQLAGDEIADADRDSVTATGFLRLGTWNDEPNDPEEYQYDRLEDLVHSTSVAFLAMTVKCARCHDHKFDPIPQDDYYGFASAFWAGPIKSRDRALLGGPTQAELKYDVLGWTDLGRRGPELQLLKNGDPKRPLYEVSPHNLTLAAALPSTMQPPPKSAATTTRRLQMASWITARKNPLTARVIVNRIWSQYFGKGLVSTVDNFGFAGQKPSHPELLDWLANELIESGWSLKHVHRLILESHAYRQASRHPDEQQYRLSDPSNSLLWMREMHRLDAEGLRDALLVASRSLNRQMYGESFRPTIAGEVLEGLSRKASAWTPSPASEQDRRSLYIFSQRSLLVPFMTTFDFCDTVRPCGQRSESTVAPQALTLMNAPFVHRQSELIAEQISKRTESVEAQVRHAFEQILSRSPTHDELRMGVLHIRQQAELRARPSSDAGNGESESVIDAAIHLRADRGVTVDAGKRVSRWTGIAGEFLISEQPDLESRPKLIKDGFNGHPVIRFDGINDFLHVPGQVLESQEFTILAVASDRAPAGHRELFSNWDGSEGNAGSSLFVGMTGRNKLRLSDAFSGVGQIENRSSAFVLTAINSSSNAILEVNGVRVAEAGRSLPNRNLTTRYVIGQQGDINGEFWNGDVAELVVVPRALSENELRPVTRSLATRYGINIPRPAVRADGLASLCHVLLNTNEFLYVD